MEGAFEATPKGLTKVVTRAHASVCSSKSCRPPSQGPFWPLCLSFPFLSHHFSHHLLFLLLVLFLSFTPCPLLSTFLSFPHVCISPHYPPFQRWPGFMGRSCPPKGREEVGQGWPQKKAECSPPCWGPGQMPEFSRVPRALKQTGVGGGGVEDTIGGRTHLLVYAVPVNHVTENENHSKS